MFNCNILVVDPKFVCIFVHLAAKICNIMSYTWIFWSVLRGNINQVKFYIKTKLTLTQSTHRTTSCPSVVERLMLRMLMLLRIMSKTGMAISADFVGQNSKPIPSYSATYSPNIPPDLMFLIYLKGKVSHDFHCYRYKISTTIILQPAHNINIFYYNL